MCSAPELSEPLRLFISYAHEDEQFREELDGHLKPLEHEGLVLPWHDRKITPGQPWDREIAVNLDNAQLILLLVSPDFIASDYCYDIEMDRALEMHQRGDACVIPVVVRSCDWSRSPFAHIQALPKDGKPLRKWSSRDDGFLDVVRGIRMAIRKLQSSSPPTVRTIPEAGKRDSEGIVVSTDQVGIELTINVDFNSFTPSQQEGVMDAIRNLLEAESGLTVIYKRPGSVKLGLKLTAEQAERLEWAIRRGELDAFNVSAVRQFDLNDSKTHCSATVQNRMKQIESEVEDLVLPHTADRLGEDEEWCEVVTGGEKRRIRFHDYADVIGIPGLYEELFCDRLEYCSPSYMVNLLDSVVREYREDLAWFRVLDVGAGNGAVGDELRAVGVESVVGVDVLPAAKEAADRDRPGVYDGYHIVDLTDLPESEEVKLRQMDLTCLTTVSSLGFDDLSPLAFTKALDLIATPGWLAFNLKEDFLRERDSSGFSRLIRLLNRDGYIQTLCYRRYQHRVSIAGEPLFYVAVVSRKLKDLDSDLLESLKGE